MSIESENLNEIPQEMSMCLQCCIFVLIPFLSERLRKTMFAKREISSKLSVVEFLHTLQLSTCGNLSVLCDSTDCNLFGTDDSVFSVMAVLESETLHTIVDCCFIFCCLEMSFIPWQMECLLFSPLNKMCIAESIFLDRPSFK